LRSAVTNAIPFLRFRVERVLAGRDLATAEARARAATAALEVIGSHPDPLVRDQYVMDLADRLRLPPDELRTRLAGRGRAAGARPDRGQSGSAGEERAAVATVAVLHDSPELEALRLVLAQPEDLAESLHDALFADPLCLDAYRSLRDAQWRVGQLADTSNEVLALLQRLGVEQPVSEPAEVIERLAEAAGQRQLAVLGNEARMSGDERALELAGVVAWLKPLLEALRDPRTAPDAAPVLLGWLIDRHEGRT
jgi:DNA primase